jgi:serine/threonine-protein kinase
MPVAPDLSGVALEGRYELHEVLGEGTFGRVYRGIDRRLARPVAVKVIKPWWAEDPEWVDAFEREAQLLARVSSPGIVQIYDVGQAREGLYYVSELVDGESLARRLKRGPIEPAKAAMLAEQLCRALAEAHAQRIIHRDVKPANILITRDGRVKVGDFGVARLAEGTTDGGVATVVGTPRYMAPEQGRGAQTTPATDVYSAGIVLYEMLAGTPPFTGSSVAELALSHLQEAPPPLPDTAPVRLREIVATALAKDPDDRYQDAGEMAAAIREARRRGHRTGVEQTIKAPPRAPTKRHNPAARRRTVALFVLVAAIIAAMLIVAFATRSGPTSKVPGVKGATRGAVLARMRRSHLKVHFKRHYSASVASGRVISQDPRAGQRVDRNSAVTVVVSRGPRPVRVPSLLTLSDHDARTVLGTDGLHARVITGADPGATPGTVYKQEPAKNVEAQPHSTVTLYEAESPTWKRVTSFAGSGPDRSVPFTIRGKQWRIVYAMSFNSAFCTIVLVDQFCGGPSVTVVEQPSGGPVVKFGMNAGSGLNYVIHTGAGDYQVIVTPGNSSQYQVEVDDFY